MIDINNWTYQEFKAFVLLYAAYADLKLEESEIQLIIEKVGDETYNRISGNIQEMNDYEKLQTILSFKERFFPNQEKKEAILKDIQEIVMADNKLQHIEQGLLYCLKRLM